MNRKIAIGLAVGSAAAVAAAIVAATPGNAWAQSPAEYTIPFAGGAARESNLNDGRTRALTMKSPESPDPARIQRWRLLQALRASNR